MRAADFDYLLPEELIAQMPAARREDSRLLVLRRTGPIEHRHFPDLLDYVEEGDVLVLNDSKVIPARLRGRNEATGGRFELLLLEENAANDWWCMMRPGKRARPGTRIQILDSNGAPTGIEAGVVDGNDEGHRRVRFTGTENILRELERLGEVPLPPYIERAQARREDRERYQTVYARAAGSVAAPTAGLHFTRAFLEKLGERGVKVCFVTLHVGPGTFAPVKAESLEGHVMHEERYEVSAETAATVNEARGKIIAVGTTTLRVLESVARAHEGRLVAGTGRTRLFVHPPSPFYIVDGLVTNFHLPRSTLLMLVAAFVAPGETSGRERILAAYAEAIARRYRFFSYGDAMVIL